MADERFRKVQEQYAILKAQLDAGLMPRDQFEAALRPLMFQDEQGNYWMIGVDSGRCTSMTGSSGPRQNRPFPPPRLRRSRRRPYPAQLRQQPP